MAGIREIARQYRDEIMDGIAWVAIWKTGKSWNAKAFWLNTDNDMIEDEDMQEARDIVAADTNAIFINAYYCAHMGEGELDDIVAGIRFFYEQGWHTLEDSTAYRAEAQTTEKEELAAQMAATIMDKGMEQADREKLAAGYQNNSAERQELERFQIAESKKERYMKYTEIINRAESEGMKIHDRLSAMMDIESADKKFNIRLDDWLAADTFNFLHDFAGIRDNIDRGSGFPATDFGLFVPRFAGKKRAEV